MVLGKRLFDVLCSGFGLLILSPIFVLVAIYIKLDSKGPIFFKQIRVTQNGKKFKILKFRTMRINSEEKGQLTVGKDHRITKSGEFLRKTKLDELAQLINVFMGDMSLVGPRPEVPKYVELYTEKQREILKMKAGITDYASIYFANENELLEEKENPEQYYIDEIMPKKIELNKKYIREASVMTDIKIIILTILKILK